MMKTEEEIRLRIRFCENVINGLKIDKLHPTKDYYLKEIETLFWVLKDGE